MINLAESIVKIGGEAFGESGKRVKTGVWERVRGGRKGENLVERVRLFSGLRLF
jgi:hypothetical protein